ncbi:MAG: B12-binding domain-containing radical SAM protein [Thermoleophilia bacterium]
MKLLLISGAVSGEKRYGNLEDIGSYLPPYGLCCLGAVLEKAGHEVMIIDSVRHPLSLLALAEKVKQFQPELIGLSVYSIGANQAIETAKAIKSEFGIPIVAGGPHVMVFPDDLAQCEAIDYLVTGEGEYSLLELVETIESGGNLDDVPGIYFHRDGEVVRNDARPLIDNLDDLPYPAFHLIEGIETYAPHQMVYRRKPVVTLITSRGCPFQCIFCNSVWTHRWRGNSAEYVVGLVERVIKEFGAREVSFHEDTFALNKRRVLEICRLMKERGINIPWTATVNLTTLDREVIKAMKDAGCWLVSCGIESGSDEVLRFIHKPVDKETVRRVLGWLSDEGIRIRGYFMIGHLIETRETIRETIDFAKSLPLYSMNISVMYLAPGSQAREIAHEYGSTNMSLDIGSSYQRGNLGFVPNGLTADYIQEMHRKAIVEFFVRPRQFVRLATAIRGPEDIRRYYRLVRSFVKVARARS